MLRALLLFGAGWYFGRNAGAGQQLVAAGQQLLDATTGRPVTTSVLPDTAVVSPEKANQCKEGYTWWPQYNMCLDPRQDAAARKAYEAGQEWRPRG